MQGSSTPATVNPYPNQNQNHNHIPNPNPNPNQYPSAAFNGYPPPHNSAYHYLYTPPQNNSRVVLYRRLFVIFMTCLLIMTLALFIFLLVVRPHLPDVSLNSLSVSGFNVSNSMVGGTWDLQFQVRNPNSKMWLYYDEVTCAVFYREASLSGLHLPPFDQGTKDQTPINATLSVASNYLEGRLVDSIGKDRASRGRVEFNVKLISFVGFRYGALRRKRYITVFCDDVAVDLPARSNSGKMIGPAKDCKVY